MANLDFFQKEISNIHRQLIDKLDRLVVGLSALSDTELIQIAKQIDFFKEMQLLGYDRLINKVGAAFDDEIAFVFSQLDEKQLGRISIASIDALNEVKLFELDYLTSNAKQYANQLKTAMMRGLITGETSPQIISGLSVGFGVGKYISSSEAIFLLGDAFTRFSRTSTAKAYLNFPKTKFTYDGPFDNKTREACQRALKEGPLTQAQINGLGYIDFNNGGGWNCRHRWAKSFED